jgi:hypothetical protein
MRMTPNPAPFRGVLAEPILHGGMPLAVNLDPVVRDRGHICLRQEDPGSEDGDDICVFIRPEHVPALIRRLQQLIK